MGQYAAISLLGVYPQTENDYLFDHKGEYAGRKAMLVVNWSKAPTEMQSFLPIIEQMLNCDPSEPISMDSAIEKINALLHNFS